jgi:hypothetical protein
MYLTEPVPSSEREDLERRFRAKVNLNGPVMAAELGPCHEWTGGLSKNGYGTFKVGGIRQQPRVS